MTSSRYPSSEADTSLLAQPLTFKFASKTAPNRFLKSAMTERLSSWDPIDLPSRGIPSKEIINVYRRWGEASLGTILTGNIMIDYDQLEAPGNPIIPPDAPFSGPRFDAFAELATQAKKHGSLIVGQLSHPGRQVQDKINQHPLSASDIHLTVELFGMTFAKPRAATQTDIQYVIEAFTNAAEFLYHAGYDGIELHGAHGYLISQFLSPSTNHRTDEYGGSLPNRARIILEIAASIRARLPASAHFIIGIKVNSVEFQQSGQNFTASDSIDLVSILETEGHFDFVELSGGSYEGGAFEHKRDSTRVREAFFLEFADAIAPRLSKTKVFVTGGFRTVGAMVKALDTIDGVGLARPLCQEPRLAADMLAGKVQGAIVQGIDPDNFGLGNVAGGTQIRQMGRDEEPIDLSKGENVGVFMESMGQWAGAMAADTEGKMYGYLDVDRVAVPYGVVAA